MFLRHFTTYESTYNPKSHDHGVIQGKCGVKILHRARRAGSDGSKSASGSAGPGIDPRRGSKFSF